MIEYLASIAALAVDPVAQEERAPGVDEILKAFSSFFQAVPDEFRESQHQNGTVSLRVLKYLNSP